MNAIDGVILAGGRSSRMGERNKTECLLAGRPMLDWVIEAARPQVRFLALNRPDDRAPAHPSLPLIPDRHGGFHGPLMGLYSALAWFTHHHQSDWLALFACDTPFIPHDLVARLYEAAQNRRASAALVSLAGKAQPTASLWHCSLLPHLRNAVEVQREAGFRPLLERVAPAWLHLDETWTEAFLNVNTPADLALAEQIARRRPFPPSPENTPC